VEALLGHFAAVTQATRNVTRHKDLPVLRRYIRAATAFDDVDEVL
jgi:hypothetical protein